MTKTPMTFTQILDHAQGYGWRIRDLAAMLAIHHPCEADGPVGRLDAEDYRKIGDQLQGIEVALELIGRTPNAYINREAVEPMEEIVLQAGSLLSEEWVKEQLKDADRELGRETIPF